MNQYQNLTQSEKSKVHKRALLLNGRGYGAKEISGHLRDEGFHVSYRTIEAWLYNGIRSGRA